jgi:hypothetical protein
VTGLLVVGLSGILLGAGLSARRSGAPRALAGYLYASCVLCLVLVGVLGLASNG